MNSFHMLKVNIMFWVVIFGLFSIKPSDAQTGNSPDNFSMRFHINSKILNEDRDISLFLPASYTSSENYYPLLVILDGEDFFHSIAGMVSYYSKIGKCPELIVVGIDARDRWHDYTPTHAPIPDGTPLPTSGEAELFYKFIKMELIKSLESKYRISPFHILYGHSIAGLFVVNEVFDEQSDFSGFIATSPSLWWDHEVMTRKAKASAGFHFSHPRYLFFTIGNEGPTMLDPILTFKKSLNERDNTDIIWKFAQYDDVDHQTMPIKAFIYGLEFIFSDWQMPQTLSAEGLDAIVTYYDNLSRKYMQRIQPPENTINSLGYKSLNEGNLDVAIRFFQYNIESYPHSGNVYDSMGDGYLKQGDSTRALINYKKSLELNPDNDHARKIIFKLESN